MSAYPEILFGRVFVAELFLLGSITLFDGLAAISLFIIFFVSQITFFTNFKHHFSLVNPSKLG